MNENSPSRTNLNDSTSGLKKSARALGYISSLDKNVGMKSQSWYLKETWIAATLRSSGRILRMCAWPIGALAGKSGWS
jgi:hypothetical protein